MAHENCLGTWENSKLGGVLEGNGIFEVASPSGDVIRGHHQGHNNSLFVGKCNGEIIRFCLVDETNGEVIVYKGRITQGTGKLFINGKFKRPLEDQDAMVVADSIVIDEGKRVLVAPDDWTAEKPT